MHTVIRAESRGEGDHGWLRTRHTFSFADYYDPERMGFGRLRVLNDDTIAPGKGFPTHPHKDMEIVTIVTKGELRHEDDTGKSAVLRPGDVQVMSAGSGIRHSEYNNSNIDELELFQLWIIPEREGIEPRHEEASFGLKEDRPTTLASGGEQGLRIHQDARVILADLTKPYTHEPKEASFIMVVEGAASVAGERLGGRDAIGIQDEGAITITPEGQARMLIIDVPRTT